MPNDRTLSFDFVNKALALNVYLSTFKTSLNSVRTRQFKAMGETNIFWGCISAAEGRPKLGTPETPEISEITIFFQFYQIVIL